MTFFEQTTLGRTGLKVGRLGISSSFGAPAMVFEEAFERGCNSIIWGRTTVNALQLRMYAKNRTVYWA